MSYKINQMTELMKSNPVKKCKGLFWRCRINSYVSNYENIEVKKSLRLLKRRSCPGCAKCGWIMEYFKEDIENYSDYIGNLENEKIYTFRVRMSQGFEDQYPEIDCIEFVEVK